MIEITIKGRIPSKKNSQRIFNKIGNGRKIPFITSSQAHKVWHNESMIHVLNQYKGHVVKRCSVDLFFTFGDKKKTDLTNKAESVMDLLVDCHVIYDDSWSVCRPIKIDCVYKKKCIWG